jgi:hypothetical protein
MDFSVELDGEGARHCLLFSHEMDHLQSAWCEDARRKLNATGTNLCAIGKYLIFYFAYLGPY